MGFEGQYSADKAINGDLDMFSFSHTQQGEGQYWCATFDGFPKRVYEVRILN